MATARKPAAAKADEEAVATMEHEGGPDPEIEKLKKELAEVRAEADERVKRAAESAKIEKRPAITSDPFQADYNAKAEIDALWPEAADQE
jgi:hypothetical protein